MTRRHFDRVYVYATAEPFSGVDRRPAEPFDRMWRWRVVARNGRVLAASSEAFTSRARAVGNLRRLFGRRLRLVESPRGELVGALMVPDA